MSTQAVIDKQAAYIVDLEMLVADLSQHIVEATPTNMGGVPDLFHPEGGWDAWERRAMDLHSRQINLSKPSDPGCQSGGRS